MRKTDIKVGEFYRATDQYPLYGAKVEVLEIGVERDHYRKKASKDGVRVRVVLLDGELHSLAVGDEIVTATRNIENPWTSENDEQIARKVAYQERRKKIAARIQGLDGVKIDWSGKITLTYDAAEDLLDRAGVPR